MTPDQTNLLEVRGLCLKFADKVVLEGVDFDVRSGEVLIIMGVSGCGKSTLLSIILGLLKSDAGSVLFKNEDLIVLPREKLNLARRKMGMVFQNAALVSSMSVRDNIALPLEELTDKPDDEIDAVVDQKLQMVGLAEAREKMPSELSGGMQKRVGLARALALDPELVLFDEPSAGLDPVNSQAIDELIIELRDKHHVTSVVVTHEMDSAFAVASRMAFLHEGKIILQGIPEDFRQSDHPAILPFLSAYLGHEKKGSKQPS
jgi:phospholipid/cholesterol/gamma-HCH transport system ATP-binding protein